MEQQKYYGNKKVTNIDGNTVTLETGEIVTFTDTQMQYILTDNELTDTELRTLVVSKIVIDMFDILDNHDLKKDDFQAVLTTLTGSYNTNFQNAVAKQFGTYNPELPTETCVGNIRMSHIANILKQGI